MATDKRLGSKVPKFVDNTQIYGAKNDSSTYKAVVKNNVDPTRAGRLQVFIPDFGGIEYEESHWITVSYASPYMGSTRWPSVKKNRPIDNDYQHVNHSYGMWMTPPDIGNFVLVTFAGGKVNQGYWFACIIPELSHHAIPAQGGSMFLEKPKDAGLAAALKSPPYPATEFNEVNKSLYDKWTDFLTIPKPIHEDLIYRLLAEGLEDDKVRGVISTSSQRESPSRVFGISTPGRDGPDKDTGESEAVMNRVGGHSIVMDDGDKDGKDKLIRLRSAGGHQILMNDEQKVLYIANATGDSWMEFDATGRIHMFANNDINIRTKKDLNIHADHDINMFAGNDMRAFSGKSMWHQSPLVNIKATTDLNMYGGQVEMSSGSTMKLSSAGPGSWGAGPSLVFSAGVIHLNTMAAPPVTPPVNIPIGPQPEARPTSPAPIYKWQQIATLQTTIPGPVPTHEPCVSLGHASASGNTVYPVTPGSGYEKAGLDSSGAPGPAPGAGQTAGPATAAGQGVFKPASAAQVAAQPPSVAGIGNLNPTEVTALKAQIGYSESGAKGYGAVGGDNNHFLGKYQVGAGVLDTQGYVKPGTKGAGLDDPANWTGKDGISSKADFLASSTVQEKVMDANLNSNYKSLVAAKTIGADTSNADVSGLLASAHLVGAGGTTQWAKGSAQADAFGTTATQYFNTGRYANTVLAGGGTAGAGQSGTQVASVTGGNITPVG